MKTHAILLLLFSLHDALAIKLPYDTIIVGMGTSGITAASTLVNAGRRVLALEAQDRIGGRLQSVKFGDGMVELGGDLVEGTKNNIDYETAMKFNIDLVVQNKSRNVFMSDGYNENFTLVNELIDFAFKNINKPPKEPNTLGNVIKRRLLNYIKENYPNLLQDQDFVVNFVELVRLLIVEYEGANDWNDLSAVTTFKTLPGRAHSWHRYGHETYHDILLNTYNNGPGLPTLDTKLNKEVVRINWPQNSTGDVEVVCKDGDVYTADNVLVTVSVGVLKENYTTLFSPSLPNEKITAINTISLGIGEKMIFSFDEEWLPNGRLYDFLWRNEERAKLTEEDSWTASIGQCTTPVGSRRVITCQTRGDASLLIASLPEEEVKTKMMEFLTKFLGSGITVPKPNGMIITNWHKNPYIRGSFTYDNLSIYEYPYARLTLGEPLVDGSGNPKVLFAGEASSYGRYATVDGASETGKREAERILRYI